MALPSCTAFIKGTEGNEGRITPSVQGSAIYHPNNSEHTVSLPQEPSSKPVSALAARVLVVFPSRMLNTRDKSACCASVLLNSRFLILNIDDSI